MGTDIAYTQRHSPSPRRERESYTVPWQVGNEAEAAPALALSGKRAHTGEAILLIHQNQKLHAPFDPAIPLQGIYNIDTPAPHKLINVRGFSRHGALIAKGWL